MKRIIISCIILVLVIPILINELYKINEGYITMWSAADVLSFYGDILQGVISGVGIYLSILYVRKQMKYEHTESTIREKICKIKDEFSNFIEILYPLKLYKITLIYDINTEMNGDILEKLLLYQIEIKSFENRIRCIIDFKNNSYLSELYSELLLILNKLIDFADEIYTLYNKVLNDNCSSDLKKYKNDLDEIIKKLTEFANYDYMNALKKKEYVFENIENELDKTLTNILKIK